MIPGSPSVAIGTVTGSEVVRRTDEIVAIFGAVFAAPPYRGAPWAVREYGERLRDDATREGFRAVVAEDAGRVVGFAHGQTSRPGQWWHDVVRRALDAATGDAWLADAFELSMLAVRAPHRRHGIGGALHDALIKDLPHRTAIASTADGDDPVLAFYRRRGWVVLRERLVFPGVEPPYTMIGLDGRAIL